MGEENPDGHKGTICKLLSQEHVASRITITSLMPQESGRYDS